MITEDYVSLETAKLLKEKGFDAECDYLYADRELIRARGGACNWNNGETLFADYYRNECSAPTLQMAMKWLRELKRCIIVIIPMWFTPFGCAKYAYSIWADDNLEIDGETDKDTEYDTYEEACESAIKYCLENLI